MDITIALKILLKKTQKKIYCHIPLRSTTRIYDADIMLNVAFKVLFFNNSK